MHDWPLNICNCIFVVHSVVRDMKPVEHQQDIDDLLLVEFGDPVEPDTDPIDEPRQESDQLFPNCMAREFCLDFVDLKGEICLFLFWTPVSDFCVNLINV